MTPEERSMRELFMAEMWPVCRELSREERAVQAALATCAETVKKAPKKSRRVA